jgi:hypothetical protein
MADLKGDVRTMQRKLDQFLFLLVQDRQGLPRLFAHSVPVPDPKPSILNPKP